MHIILYVFRPFNRFYGYISYVLPITYCLMQKHTPGMYVYVLGYNFAGRYIFDCYTGHRTRITRLQGKDDSIVSARPSYALKPYRYI